jgi:hypothetical protein
MGHTYSEFRPKCWQPHNRSEAIMLMDPWARRRLCPPVLGSVVCHLFLLEIRLKPCWQFRYIRLRRKFLG